MDKSHCKGVFPQFLKDDIFAYIEKEYLRLSAEVYSNGQNGFFLFDGYLQDYLKGTPPPHYIQESQIYMMIHKTNDSFVNAVKRSLKEHSVTEGKHDVLICMSIRFSTSLKKSKNQDDLVYQFGQMSIVDNQIFDDIHALSLRGKSILASLKSEHGDQLPLVNGFAKFNRFNDSIFRPVSLVYRY